jgi:hypothetical protein
MVAVVVVVLVVIVVLVAVFAGWVPGVHLGSSTSSGGGGGPAAVPQENFSTAFPIASSAASAHGHGWILTFADGFDSTTAYQNTSAPQLDAGCPFTGGASTYPKLPAFTGDYASGSATGWVFYFYQNSSAPASVLAIWVTGNGQASVLGSVSGSSCVSSGYSEEPGVNSSIVDSSQVAIILGSADYDYVTTYPEANAYYIVASGQTEGGVMYPPTWSVLFSTCPSNGGGTGEQFYAQVNAATQTVTSDSMTNVTCSAGRF